MELYNLLINAKLGDEKATLMIVERFNPLLIKYSNKLGYDGAKSDLIICLLETIKIIPIEFNSTKNDGYIVSYIHTSIKHKYIHLSKKNCRIISTETELYDDLSSDNPYEFIDSEIFLNELLNKLPDLQRDVIEKIYIYNISESELAKLYQVSRQAINRIKNRGLVNLRKILRE